MTWKTFEEWKSVGFSIKKGMKSELREPNTGLSLFNEKQVEDYEDSREYGIDIDEFAF